MLSVNRIAFSSKDIIFHLLRNQNKSQALHSVSYGVISKRREPEDLQSTNFQRPLLRSIHVTRVNKDLEAGLRALGAGVAATGVIGSGIGIGIIFGNYVSSIARNPSAAGMLMLPAILGMSFCEALGLFAVVVAFVIQ